MASGNRQAGTTPLPLVQNPNCQSTSMGPKQAVNSVRAATAVIQPVKPEYASVFMIADFIPRADPEKSQINSLWTWSSQRHILLWSACAAAILTLGANLVITVVFYFKFDVAAVPGSDPALYRGDCTYASRLGSGLHVLINLLSTILLGASNLCMQLLLAPSRAQIDKAHAENRWLEIGIQSYHNFRHMSLLNKLTWMLLALSSLPLHFLYNSAVYNTIPAWQKEIFVGTSVFPTNGTCNPHATSELLSNRSDIDIYSLHQAWGNHPVKMDNLTIGRNGDFSDFLSETDCKTRQELISRGSEGYPQRISAIDCLNRYTQFFNNQTFVVMISKYDLLEQKALSNESNSLLFYGDANIKEVTGFDRPSWVCGQTNTFDCRRPELWQRNQTLVEDWNILMYKIDSCLVWEYSLDNMCSVRYSLIILIVVCVANLCKLIGIAIAVWVCFYAARGQSDQLPLATLGDALQSFLSRPDNKTINCCLQERKDLSKKNSEFWIEEPQPREWQANPRRRYRTASLGRWLWTILPTLALIGFGIAMTVIGFDTIKQKAGDYGYAYSMSWGAADQNALGLLNMSIDRPSSDLRLAITMFANLWQWAVSVLYVQQNSLLTTLCVEAEWQSYATERKGLRVTSPKGLQRSTYFVSLPARYGLTLQVIFAFWHWTLSQSAFLVVVEGFWHLPGWNNYGEYKPDPLVPDDLPFIAFSPWPTITSIVIGVCIPILITALSFKRDAGVLPMGGTCSAVISAACHRPKGDKEAHLFPVTWGEIPSMARQVSLDNKVPKDPTPATHTSNFSRWKDVGSINGAISVLSAGKIRFRKSASNGNSHLPILTSPNTRDDQIQPSPGTKQSLIVTSLAPGLGAAQIKNQVVGHCSFTTSISVHRPVEGRRYV